jgi:hypothetical protein
MWLTDIPYKLPEPRTEDVDAPTTVCYGSHTAESSQNCDMLLT